MNKNNIVHLVMIGIILILAAIIIFRKPTMTVISGREKQIVDSLALLQSQLDSSEIRVTNLQRGYDSLNSLEPGVIYRTHDKVKFIFSDATPDDLDNIIRANWKTESRYK